MASRVNVSHQYHGKDNRRDHNGEDNRCYNEPCPICPLAFCEVCKGGEGGLTSDCPGVQIPNRVSDAVYNQQIDFILGSWVLTKP